MIRLFLAIGLSLVPLATASAQNLTGQVTAVCAPGQGCECYDGQAPEDIAWVELFAAGDGSVNIPAGWAGDVRSQTVVIDRGSGQVYRSGEPRAAINSAYGGRGDCEPAPRPVEEIVPLDGTWQWRTLGETASGCPPMMTQMLTAGRTETLSTRVAWQGRFHPGRLANDLPQPEIGAMSAYQWRQLGPNRWLSDNIRDRNCEDGTCVDVSVALSMTLVSPDRATGLLALRSRVEAPDGTAAVLAGYGMLDCRVRVRYEIRRIGP